MKTTTSTFNLIQTMDRNCLLVTLTMLWHL